MLHMFMGDNDHLPSSGTFSRLPLYSINKCYLLTPRIRFYLYNGDFSNVCEYEGYLNQKPFIITVDNNETSSHITVFVLYYFSHRCFFCTLLEPYEH